MMDFNSGRTWTNAPSGVRSARALAWLGAFFSGILAVVFLFLLFSGGLKVVNINIVNMVIYSIFFPIYVWLLSGLKSGVKSAYYVQLVISIIGLINFPIGTLINGYILYLWMRPETKAWFGV